jgi:hypothetical protein
MRAKTKQQSKIMAKKKPKNQTRTKQAPSFGPVASIATAPVAIGNSIRGSSTQTIPTKNGVVATGRDFMFAPVGTTSSIQGWTCVGGTPITPAAFTDSSLRQYLQLYAKFKWRKCIAHYITSSPTSSNGDVMFYYGKNRNSVFLNQSSPNLLPFVMSDDTTVLGPQWTNHSTVLSVKSDWMSTDYGMTSDINSFADGELFLLSKTSSVDSPGYVLFDYEIEFAEIQISPRLLSLPLTRVQYSQFNFGYAASAINGGNAVYATPIANNISGGSSVFPSGYAVGDLYKIVIDLTNSLPAGWINVTPATLWKENTPGFGGNPLPISDGLTLYAIGVSSGTMVLVVNPESAYTAVNAVQYSNTVASATFNLQCWVSLIGTVGTTNLIP